ncbi:MAG: tRNA lysidine(34) synthetase TilS [Phycisphaerales bacterium]
MRNQPSTRLAAGRGGLESPALPSRRDAVVRRVAAQWRLLTTGELKNRRGAGKPTLIACSGGGDSSALVLALAAAAGQNAAKLLTVGHVVHDLRNRAEAEADRDIAARLAERVGLPFVEASVRVREQVGNAEGNARRARYAALSQMAIERGIGFVATAHNSHDQVESVLMNLLRGSGPRGLAGAAASRVLSRGGQGGRGGWGGRVVLVRPMLEVAPLEARGLCDACGWRYAEDATNADTTRLRNALRHDVVPRLLALRPGSALRIASAAERCGEASLVVDEQAKALLARVARGQVVELPREALRSAPVAVVAEVLRRAALRVNGERAKDRLSGRTLAAAARLVRSRETDPKELVWPGVRVSVDAHAVRIAARVGDSA